MKTRAFYPGMAVVLAAVVWFCWSCEARAAQIESSAEPAAYKPGSAYKKSIPGSTSAIRGSKPRSYIKPKKMTYKEHMASLRTHRFTNEESSFGRKTAPPSSVISKRPPGTVQAPVSRIKINKSIGHPGPGIARQEALSNNDLAFLGKLTDTVRANDPAVGARLAQITAAQKRGQTLSKDDYNFLNEVAKKINDGQASFRIHSIAEKRRETGR